MGAESAEDRKAMKERTVLLKSVLITMQAHPLSPSQVASSAYLSP